MTIITTIIKAATIACRHLLLGAFSGRGSHTQMLPSSVSSESMVHAHRAFPAQELWDSLDCKLTVGRICLSFLSLSYTRTEVTLEEDCGELGSQLPAVEFQLL